MAGARHDGSRGSARVIPITKRQRKQAMPETTAVRRAQTTTISALSTAQGDQPTARRRRAHLALVQSAESSKATEAVERMEAAEPVNSSAPASEATPILSVTQPRDPDASGARDTESPASQSVTSAATSERTGSAPRLATPADGHGDGVSAENGANLEPTAPRRVRVRVRRKRPTSPDQSGDQRARLNEANADSLPAARLSETPETPSPTDVSIVTEDQPSADPTTPAWLKNPRGRASASTPAARDHGREHSREDFESAQSSSASSSRKLPTLAVMMALEGRSETSGAQGAPDFGATAPLTPLATPVPAEDAKDAREANATLAQSAITPELPASDVSLDETLSAAADIAAFPLQRNDDALLSDLRALYVDSQPSELASSRPHSRSLWATRMLARRLMWWQNGHAAAELDERAASRAQPPVSPGPPETLASAIESDHARNKPAIRRSPRITRKLGDEDAPRLTPELAEREPDAQSFAAQRAQDDEPVSLLTWAGGAQAALCVAGALVAALALLNSSAGARALQGFAWAMAFTLIAGVGAALGHLAWRARHARLAALALVVSQLALFGWALALLGARPALMTLAPFIVALALRAVGRAAALVTGLVALGAYAGALAGVLTGNWAPIVVLPDSLATVLDCTLIASGMTLLALALASLYSAGARERAHTRAVERAARHAEAELAALRTQTEDDADAIRQALANALRGVLTEDLQARGALSPLAEQAGTVAARLVELGYERERRKRLESATRRLIRNMERAWLGLSWEWPEPSGVMLDDLVALLRTQPPSQPARLLDEPPSTGQVVAPHLYRNSRQPGGTNPSTPSIPGPFAIIAQPSQAPSQPLQPQLSLWPDRSQPSEPFDPSQLVSPPSPQNPGGSNTPASAWLNHSQPSQPYSSWPSSWPSDPEPTPPGTEPLELPPAPPAPRWRTPAENGWLVE